MDGDKEKRHEKEIRALLNDMPEFLPDDEPNAPIPFRRKSTKKPAPQVSRGQRPKLLVARNVAVLSFVFLVLSYVVRYFPVPGEVGTILALCTVVFMVLALVMAYREQRGPAPERRWRGQVITLPSDTPAWKRKIGQQWWRIRATIWRRRRH